MALAPIRGRSSSRTFKQAHQIFYFKVSKGIEVDNLCIFNMKFVSVSNHTWPPHIGYVRVHLLVLSGLFWGAFLRSPKISGYESFPHHGAPKPTPPWKSSLPPLPMGPWPLAHVCFKCTLFSYPCSWAHPVSSNTRKRFGLSLGMTSPPFEQLSWW